MGDAPGPQPVGHLATPFVGGQRRGALGGGSSPVGGETARFDDRDLDPEAGDFLGESLAEGLDELGRPVREATFANDPAGHLEFIAWARAIAVVFASATNPIR